MNIKFVLPVLLVVGGVVLAGCQSTSDQAGTGSSTGSSTMQETGSAPSAVEKRGDTSKTGQISSSGGRYYIQSPGGWPEEIESYSVDLSQYVGQSVTVTGQFSGDTLFVAKVE